MEKNIKNVVMLFLILLVAAPLWAISQDPNASSVFKQEELDQLVAPVALYPDSLISQILMASTYPLEVVEAERWAKQNKDLQGDALAAALEKENWDPSVKSLVNFPQVLSMMSEKLDWTQKLGDAFLSQQKGVMDTVQKLRNKAYEQGNLKTTEQQVVNKVEPDVIVIESADPQVIYVPTYDSSEVYGEWPYTDYPPNYYDYYPSGYVAGGRLLSFGLGMAVGAGWGYAWGQPDWDGGNINIDASRNFDANRNIDRGKYAQQYRDRGQFDQSGRGKWQHNPADRRGVPYRDQGTAQRFNRASTADAVKSREAFRGRAEQGRQEIAGGAADRFKGQQGVGRREGVQGRDIGAGRDLSSRGGQGMGQRGDSTGAARARTSDMRSRSSSSRGGAFQDMDRGSSARNFSSRGQASRQSMSRPSGGGRGGGGRGGGGRGGGGGRR